MTKFKRFIVAGDVHGDMSDDKANAAFFKFCAQWRPEIRICAGDLWDFRPLRGKASEDEKRESMQADFDAGVEWFNKFRPQYFLRGNHDERLWECAESGSPRADLAQILIHGGRLAGVSVEGLMRRHKCTMLPYHKRDGVLRLGSLKVIHGFNSGVYATRQHALIYGSVLHGHTHTIDEHAIPGIERRVARSIGCLCRLDMDYNARQPQSLRHAHGWAYGLINERTGAYHVWQAEEIDGKWLLPSDIVEL